MLFQTAFEALHSRPGESSTQRVDLHDAFSLSNLVYGSWIPYYKVIDEQWNGVCQSIEHTHITMCLFLCVTNHYGVLPSIVSVFAR